MEKNQLIDAQERLTKEQIKPRIANPLPHKAKIYYVDDCGNVIFKYEEAIQAKEANKHNR